MCLAVKNIVREFVLCFHIYIDCSDLGIGFIKQDLLFVLCVYLRVS